MHQLNSRGIPALALLMTAALFVTIAVTIDAQSTPSSSAARAAANRDAAQARVVAGAARLYDTSVLHEIDIVIAPQDAEQIIVRRPDRVRATFTIDGRTLTNVGVRQSGGIYHAYVPINAKPSLSIKFDEFVDGQRLFDLDKLILKNELQDVSFLSEHLSYEIFRRAGLAAPLTAHARVTINGIDNGIYLMREPIDREFLTRNFGSAFKQGNLYEIQNRVDFALQPSYPPLDDEGKNGRNRDDLIALARAVQSVTPATFVQDLGKFVDIDRLVTFVAAEIATVHWDGVSFNNNNTYMYAHPKDGRFIFIPWGADQTLGIGRSPFNRMQVAQSWLVSQLLAVPSLAQQVREERQRIESPAVWSQQVLLNRVATVAGIMATAESAGGRTQADAMRFKAWRPHVEATIK